MKATIYNGKKDVTFSEENKPQSSPREAIIKMSYAGICGTDMMIYFGKHPRANEGLIMGHEFSGVIEEIPLGTIYDVGDRVAINPLISCGECGACLSGNNNICDNLKYLGIDYDGGFAEFVKVPIQNLHLLPEGVDDESASLIEPLAVAIHTVRRSKVMVGDNVAILGAGPIGILIALIAQKAGASKVIISDLSDYRLEVARSYGLITIDAKIDDVTTKIKDLTETKGADIVFEAAGNQETANQMIPAIKSQGQIMIVSVYKEDPRIDLAQMHFRELSLSTTRCFSENDFRKAIELLASQSLGLHPIISHKLSLNEVKKGFELVEESKDSLKVLFY